MAYYRVRFGFQDALGFFNVKAECVVSADSPVDVILPARALFTGIEDCESKVAKLDPKFYCHVTPSKVAVGRKGNSVVMPFIRANCPTAVVLHE